ANYLVTRLAAQLVVGWFVATLAGVGGLYASFQMDLPTGAAIVCTLGATLLLTCVVILFRRNSRAV
ncbi:MAG TPA: metal ABC transporter permease, partial [Verrucomicrobiota bacterium]|nr:metal ABC transporter permease [Verrucomicrobiota bacterium]